MSGYDGSGAGLRDGSVGGAPDRSHDGSVGASRETLRDTSHGAVRDGSVGGSPDDEVEIVAYPNGPFLVRGNISLTTPEGVELPRDRRTIALCRCGKSVIKPFCDGTHKIIGFTTEPEPRPES